MAERSPIRPGTAASRAFPTARDALFFSRHFAADDRATRGVLRDLVGALHGAGIGAEDVATVELILAEVLNNIAEHAYAERPGPVRLTVATGPGGLACRIADRGRPMPAGGAPDPGLPHIAPPQALPEGGFGWHLIRSLTSDLVYCREAGWNTLNLRVPLSAPG